MINKQLNDATGVYIDETPQIHYIRKSDDEPYSKKTDDFSILLDNSYSFQHYQH
jgi:hypothetical protein